MTQTKCYICGATAGKWDETFTTELGGTMYSFCPECSLEITRTINLLRIRNNNSVKRD